jgi:hypothetical protein
MGIARPLSMWSRPEVNQLRHGEWPRGRTRNAVIGKRWRLRREDDVRA